MSREELREELIEQFMSIAREFYFECSDELTERTEFAPKWADKMLTLLDTYTEQREREARIDELDRLAEEKDNFERVELVDRDNKTVSWAITGVKLETITRNRQKELEQEKADE